MPLLSSLEPSLERSGLYCASIHSCELRKSRHPAPMNATQTALPPPVPPPQAAAAAQVGSCKARGLAGRSPKKSDWSDMRAQGFGPPGRVAPSPRAKTSQGNGAHHKMHTLPGRGQAALYSEGRSAVAKDVAPVCDGSDCPVFMILEFPSSSRLHKQQSLPRR